MKKSIHEDFELYKKNYKDWNDLEKFLMRTNTKEEWLQDFYKTMGSFQSIYDANKSFIEKIDKHLSKLNDELAGILYEEVFSMYMNDYNDAELVTHICKVLIEYYGPQKDYSRLVHLYTIIQNYLFDVENPEGNCEKTDITYLRKGMEFIEHYTELDDSARYRIWIIYYNYVVRLTDCGVITLEEAFDCYDMLMEFKERPEVKELDKNNSKINGLIEYMSETMFICIGRVDEVDQKTKGRLYKYVKRYFEAHAGSIKSLYELPAELYACSLFNTFMEGEITFDKVFVKYLDYFAYKFQFIKNQSEFDQDEMIQCINAIRYITKLGMHVNNQELIARALNQLVDFVETRWIKSNLTLYDRVSDILVKVCFSLVSYDVVGIDKERCITQLIIQRDINVYIHSKITEEIAMALYREITLKKPEFFDEVKSVPANEWKKFLHNACMFHDIGAEHNMGTLTFKSRPVFDEEQVRFDRHAIYGASAFESVAAISKYAEIIKGHHVYYNGENAEHYNYNRNDSDVGPFTDILALAVYIEETTNPFWNFNQNSKKFPIALRELAGSKNTRFNGTIIDLLLDNKTLQRQIEQIVTVRRADIIYDVYHNWEKLQLSEDEASILEEIKGKVQEFKVKHDEEAFKPYLLKLENLAYKSTSDDIRGRALFELMFYRMVRGDYAEGIAMSSEVEKLLKKTKNNELLAECGYDIGNAEMLRENYEGALYAYLSGLSVARRTPGCEEMACECLLSLGNIFLARYHFPKAKEYLEQCDINMFKESEQMRYLCMWGYCCVMLNDTEPLIDIKKRLEELMLRYPEDIVYPQYVYLAQIANALNCKDEFEYYLKIVKDTRLDVEEVAYYSDEMFMYIELLARIGRYEEASSIIDQYIELITNHNEYSNVLVKLLNVKLEILSNIRGIAEFAKYESMLRDVFYASCGEGAKRIEETERAAIKEIMLQEEHDEVMSNKEALEASVKKAQNDSEQKSQFLSSMSHEIRTPINAILGLNEMILRESTEETVLQYAEDIQNAGKQLLGIINDVLDYSKIEAGKMEIVPQRYNVGTLINDIKNMLEPKLAEKNLEFRVNCNAEIPDVLFGDDLRIKQILLNLLSNAYKYTKEGFVEFNIEYTKVDDQSIMVKFAVKDSGIGLKPEQVEKLAVPFERFDLVKNRGVEGTGLGMSIVVRLLEQMESRLVIESEYGKGSVFSFEIKQGVIEWNSVGLFDSNRKKFLRENGRKQSFAKGELNAPNAKVLIVDDNAVNLKVACALLKRTKIQVTSALSGMECLELCKTNEYHIIFLDHMMPEMDGIETLHHLKEEGLNKTTPTVALTANVVESLDDFYIKSGFDALLTKPINAEKMEELIASLLPEYLVE